MAPWPQPGHGEYAFMPEDEDEPVMARQLGFEGVIVLGSPAHRDHKHRDDGRDKPAQAEKTNLGSYQALQHRAGMD